MTPDAYCFYREFEAAGPAPFRMDRHYLLYALSGTLRLEARGARWTLPPARAAFIPAGQEITVSILTRTVSASALFCPDFHDSFPDELAVFDMTPLAKELVRECLDWGPETGPLTEYARSIFQTLATVTSRLALEPSSCWLPVPKSRALQQALELTEERLAKEPCFDEIAAECGQSPRSMARRFASELGMTWREVLRRMRVIHAIEALATTDQSITEVSLESGYNSLSAFNAAFRELMGQTPSEYRLGIR